MGALASVAPIPLDGHALAQLRNHGFRCTPGRIATLQVLLACAPGHVTVDEIHQRVLKRAGSATLFSDAKHSWLDALSSAGALAGLVAVAAGQRWGDPVAGLAVTLFICHVGW